jgi:formylglycine-generating enzyme required for sulfatase activity/serine/threonine protein kinase
MSSPVELSPGTLFADAFRIERRLGQGDNGAVFVVEQVNTGAQRALKVMAAGLVPDDAGRLAFEREARLGAQIESDHVVLVVGAGVDRATGMPWVAMELLDGIDLGERLSQDVPLLWTEVALIFGQLCGAIGEAHDRGIVHGDLKPSNVFLARSRHANAPFEVKVLDFGVAKLTVDPAAAAVGATGTPLWMAPEQAGPGGAVTLATDVWAIGLMAFAALTGRSYWRAASAPRPSLAALLLEITEDPLETASARAAELGITAELPSGFDTWLARCLARDPSRRFANAKQACIALATLLGSAAATAATAKTAVAHPAEPPSKGVPLEWLGPTQKRETDELHWFGAHPSPPTAPATAEARPAGDAAPRPPPATEASAHRRAARPRTKRKGVGRDVAVALVAATIPVIAVLAWKRPWQPAAAAPSTGVTIDTQAPSAPAPPAPAAAAEDLAAAETAQHALTEATAQSPLVEFRGGAFTMGSMTGSADERPLTLTKVAPFAIERHEVTAAVYAACVSAGRCSSAGTANLCAGSSSQHPQNPINCVTWKQATAYCAWLGRRLPSEAEWELAAGGPAKRAYPWAKGPTGAPSDDDLCWGRCKISAGPCDVGSFPRGRTPEGLEDMAGNVWEWTATPYCPYGKPDCDSTSVVTRGGGWCDADPSLVRTTARQANDPMESNPNIGFRCAADR